MRTYNFLTSVLGILGFLAPFHPLTAQEPIPQVNLSAIANVGVNAEIGKMPLEMGTYVVGPITGEDITEEHYLLLDQDTNDPEKFYALMIPKPLATTSTSGLARLYQGRQLSGTGSLMLTPINIDTFGNLELASETQRRAPVLQISARPGRFKYRYVVEGRNGHIGGQKLGMRGHNFTKPYLKAEPRDGIFVAGSGEGADLIVNGKELSFWEGENRDNHFSMLDMNGAEGKFGILMESNLDTLREANLPDEEIQRIAVFVNGGCFDSEVLMVLVPRISGQGEYDVKLYRPGSYDLWEKVFPGRKEQPKTFWETVLPWKRNKKSE
jgi:hypothetical protein